MNELGDVGNKHLTTTLCMWYNIRGGGSLEQKIETGKMESRLNIREVYVMKYYIMWPLKISVLEDHIKVIKSYSVQVQLIKTFEIIFSIKERTADGFQSRRKRSDYIGVGSIHRQGKGLVRFLSEQKRLNVAITGSKRHLCVVEKF